MNLSLNFLKMSSKVHSILIFANFVNAGWKINHSRNRKLLFQNLQLLVKNKTKP